LNNIEEVLSKLGYNLKTENSKYWRAQAIYRQGDNNNALRINKETGYFNDFVSGEKGGLKHLVKLTLNLETYKEADKWLNNNELFVEYVYKKPKLKTKSKINPVDVYDLLPNYSFYTSDKRNIDEKILKGLECGLQMSGRLNNRFVFVIRDEYDDIIGLTGRDLLSREAKWKKIGFSREWIYPLCAIDHILEEKRVYLVESIGDMLALRNAGFFNVIVTFGTNISPKLVNFLSALGGEIIISTNNDFDSEQNWGLQGAEKIRKSLTLLVNDDMISIKLPQLNDWGMTPKESIIEQLNESKN